MEVRWWTLLHYKIATSKGSVPWTTNSAVRQEVCVTQVITCNGTHEPPALSEENYLQSYTTWFRTPWHILSRLNSSASTLQLVTAVQPTCSVWPWLRFSLTSLTGRCKLYNTDLVFQAGRHSSFAWRSQQTVHPPLFCSWLTSPWRDSPTPEPELCLLQTRPLSPTPDPLYSPLGSEGLSRISSPGQSGPSSAWCPDQTIQAVSECKQSHEITV